MKRRRAGFCLTKLKIKSPKSANRVSKIKKNMTPFSVPKNYSETSLKKSKKSDPHSLIGRKTLAPDSLNIIRRGVSEPLTFL